MRNDLQKINQRRTRFAEERILDEFETEAATKTERAWEPSVKEWKGNVANANIYIVRVIFPGFFHGSKRLMGLFGIKFSAQLYTPL